MGKARNVITAILLLVASISLAACGSAQPGTMENPTPKQATQSAVFAQSTTVTTDKGHYTNISPESLKAMMDDKDFFLVDVHVPHEGMMPNLDARIPYNEIADHLDELPKDKTAKIVLTCMSDSMSTIASKMLADLGYTNVFNLVGGFNAWKAKGYPFTPEP